MRFFIFLLAAFVSASLSFFASAESARSLAEPAAQSQQQPLPSARCAKRIRLPDSAETACLIQKRKGRS